MPLPKPKKGETKKDWDSRCMGNPTMKKEYPDQKQRYAVCSDIWRRKKGNSMEKDKKQSFADAFDEVAGTATPVEIPASACRFNLPEDSLQAAAEDGHDFRMVGVTASKLQHFWWGSLEVDLKGLKPAKKKISALRGHDPDKIVGWYDKFALEEDGWVGYGNFAKSTPDGKEAAELLGEGFPWQGSIWFRPDRVEKVEDGASAEVNGHTFKGPGSILREAVVKEVTFTPVGVDGNTNVTALTDGEEAFSLASDRISIVSMEDDMDELELTAEQRREVILSAGRSELRELHAEDAEEFKKEGAAEEKQKVEAYVAAFKDDVAYAMDAYKKGIELPEAELAYYKDRAKDAEKRLDELKDAQPGDIQNALEHATAEEGERKRKEEEALNKDAVKQFKTRVEQLKGEGLSEGGAITRIARDEPELHEAYIEAVNA